MGQGVVAKKLLDRRLGLIEVASYGDDVQVGPGLAQHLGFLDRADPVARVKDDHLRPGHVLKAAQGCRTGITRGGR